MVVTVGCLAVTGDVSGNGHCLSVLLPLLLDGGERVAATDGLVQLSVERHERLGSLNRVLDEGQDGHVVGLGRVQKSTGDLFRGHMDDLWVVSCALLGPDAA